MKQLKGMLLWLVISIGAVLMTGCATGIVSTPLSSNGTVQEGLTYHLKTTAVTVSAVYRLSKCDPSPEAELQALTVNTATAKDLRDGAVFAIDPKELAAGSKIFDTDIVLLDGSISTINYKATDKTGDIVKDVATLAAKIGVASVETATSVPLNGSVVGGATLPKINLAGLNCASDIKLKLQRYDQNKNFITAAYGVMQTLQDRLIKPGTPLESDKGYKVTLGTIRKQLDDIFASPDKVSQAASVGTAYTNLLTALETIVVKQQGQNAPLTDAQKTEVGNAIKALQDVITATQAANDKLDTDLVVTFNGTVIPEETNTPKNIVFDYTPAIKWVPMTTPASLFMDTVSLTVTKCVGSSSQLPLCGDKGVLCASSENSKSYGIYYRTPARCAIKVTVGTTDPGTIQDREFLQFGRLNRLPFRNGPFEDTDQTITFDKDGALTDYKQSAKVSAMDAAISAAATAEDTLAQRKLNQINAQKAVIQAQKDLLQAETELYTKQKERDAALKALTPATPSPTTGTTTLPAGTSFK